MKKIKIKLKYSFDKDVVIEAIPLAKVTMLYKEYQQVKKKKLFRVVAETVEVVKEITQWIVFIPWKHQMKEIRMINEGDVIDDSVFYPTEWVKAKDFSIPVPEEYGYYWPIDVRDYNGYNFILENSRIIFDVTEDPYMALDLLYKIHPQFLQEEIDVE